MRLTFKPSRSLGEYHGVGLDLKPGQSAEVPEEMARRLIRDFPENFAQDIQAPPVDRQIKEPARRKRV